MPGNIQTPLTKDIVRDDAIVRRLLAAYPQAGPIAGELRDQIRPSNVASNTRLAARTVSLEAALGRYVQESRDNPYKRLHLLAFRFYLRDLLRLTGDATLHATARVTNQQVLLNRIIDRAKAHDRTVVIVTFNYDLLVEEAITNITGQRFDTLASLVNGPEVFIIKPHGSVSWQHSLPKQNREAGIRSTDAVSTARVLIARVAEDLIGLDEFTEMRHVMPGTKDPGIPAIAVPVEAKPGNVCPESHLEPLLRRKGMITHVLTVGWRAAEDHFLDPVLREALNRRPFKLTICTGGSAQQAAADALGVRQQFARLVEEDEIEADIHNEGFAQFLPQWDPDAWLAESMR